MRKLRLPIFNFFSNKAFSSYVIFCVGKTPLTYCVVVFWKVAKFTKFTKLLKVCPFYKLHFEPYVDCILMFLILYCGRFFLPFYV